MAEKSTGKTGEKPGSDVTGAVANSVRGSGLQ